MLSYYVMYDVFNNLEDKYKSQFTSYDRLFFSANYIKAFDCYNILKLKENAFNLKDKFTELNQKELLNYFVNEIKINNYDQELILLAYGYLINKSITDITKPYFSSLCGVDNSLRVNKNKQKLERIIGYHLRDMYPEKNEYFEKIPNTFKCKDEHLDFFCDIFAKIYKFSNTRDILRNCFKNFNFYYNQNINFLFVKRGYYSFLDKFSKSRVAIRPSLKTFLYTNTIDYLNLLNRPWLNPYTDKKEENSFLDIYQEIIDDANKRIDRFNQLVFYNGTDRKILLTKYNKILNPNLVNPVFTNTTSFRKPIFKKKKETIDYSSYDLDMINTILSITEEKEKGL